MWGLSWGLVALSLEVLAYGSVVRQNVFGVSGGDCCGFPASCLHQAECGDSGRGEILGQPDTR